MLEKNQATENGGIGIALAEGSDANTVEGNTANNNAGVGVQVSGSDRNTLRGNTANGNAVLGFDLENANDNTLVGNKADGKGSSDESSGFAVIFDSKSNVLEGNKATHFARWGFAVGLVDPLAHRPLTRFA